MEYAQTLDRFITGMRDAGRTEDEIRQSFIGFGWHPDSVDAALQGANCGSPQDLAIGPDLTGLPTRISLCGAEALVVMRMHHPDVCLLANVLSHAECQELIELAKPRLQRSKVYVADRGHSGDGVISHVRTSQQAGFRYGESESFDRLYERLSALVRWPITHMESLHVVRYLPGADFAPHHDFFPTTDQSDMLEKGGQRLASVVLYLNTPLNGGATSFLDVQTEIFPQQGSLLFFSYVGANAQTLSLHAGVPLGSGEKWIVTMFLKSKEQPIEGGSSQAPKQ